jgi:uncharacterized protein YecE (DUF72 family)
VHGGTVAIAGKPPMNSVCLGTCGWSYKEWGGVFYPKGLAAGEYLTHYAGKYPIVEVDSTFYRSPSPKMVEGWRDKTPAGFGFSLKVPQVITHEKLLKDCKGEVKSFLDAARLLGDKLLCCCLQFGYFNKKAFVNLQAFLERLDSFLTDWPVDVPVAVEIRNKSWMTEQLANRLRAHKAAWVLSDQTWMPSPLYIVQKLDAVTGSFAYIRLLGDRAEVDRLTTTLDHIVVDRKDQIHADAEAIKLLAKRVPVLAFINNHFAGYAPETLRQLQQALD